MKPVEPNGLVPSYLQDCLVDLSDNISDPFALFAVNGRLVASPGNIGVIKGAPKSGKTFTTSGFVASWLNQTCLEIVSHRLPGKNKVWVLDTEQSKAHVTRFLNEFTGWRILEGHRQTPRHQNSLHEGQNASRKD